MFPDSAESGNTYQPMHRNTVIKDYFEEIFWLKAVVALDLPVLISSTKLQGNIYYEDQTV